MKSMRLCFTLATFSSCIALFSPSISADEGAVRTALNQSAAWKSLATQTCVAQAPQNPAVARMNLAPTQLRRTCQCVMEDVYPQLTSVERERILTQMRQQQNMHAAGKALFSRSEVKSAVLACSAKAYWFGS